MIPWWKTDFGEVAAKAVHDAVMKRRMTMGPLTKDFELRLAEILDVPYVISTSSGTAALTLALLVAGVGPGDEVVVPNRTWIATAHAPRLLGADVVFADVEAERPILSPEAFAAAITPRTKAVVPVHLNGRLADMKAIYSLAKKHGILVIEDACQAIFSRFPDGGHAGCGTGSFAGCYSFSIGKPVSCGQGGAVAVRDEETARRMILARTQGVGNVITAEWEMVGGNYRFWDLPAAVALTQLAAYEKNREAVVRLYQRYRDELAGNDKVRLLSAGFAEGEVPIYAECLCERRDDFLAFLAARDIQARPYYANLNTAPQFIGANPGPYPNSDIYASQCLVLPSGPDQAEEDLEAVVAAVRDWSAL